MRVPRVSRCKQGQEGKGSEGTPLQSHKSNYTNMRTTNKYIKTLKFRKRLLILTQSLHAGINTTLIHKECLIHMSFEGWLRTLLWCRYVAGFMALTTCELTAAAIISVGKDSKGSGNARNKLNWITRYKTNSSNEEHWTTISSSPKSNKTFNHVGFKN